MENYGKKKYKRRKIRFGYELIVVFGALCAVATLKFTTDPVYYIGAFVIGVITAVLIRELYRNARKKARRQKYLSSSLSDIDHMSGETFEYCLQAHFENLGYKASTTAQTKDFGADLVMEKDGEKIVVQAKRYRGIVGIKAVQEVIGAKEYYNADTAVVATNSHFSQSAIDLAHAANVKLFDRNNLVQLLPKQETSEFGTDYNKKSTDNVRF